MSLSLEYSSNIDVMLIIFSPKVTFFEGTTFFDESAFSVLNERCEGDSKDEEGFEKMHVFLDRKVFLFRRMFLKKK